MDQKYDPSTIEPKWQKEWEKADLFTIDLAKAKKPFYAQVMFPYPSGDKLHVGHWYNFAPADSYARLKRMQGHDVFEPMGFDAFGLPAENYAIKTGVHPDVSITKNVETMITQLKRMGCMYDWSRTLNTSKPEYYRYTQWLFLQMYKAGLAYKKEGNVNFCSKCQTVLANEQCQDGTCERCGTLVTQTSLAQWYWKITKYSDALLDGLEKLDWPEKTKIMQRNWIGKKTGINISYEVQGTKLGSGLNDDVRFNDGSPGLKPGATKHDGAMRYVHLTFAPYKRSTIFEDKTFASAMLRMLSNVADRHDIVIHEAAAMPDHVHLLVSFYRERDLQTDIVRKLKGGSSHDFMKRFNFDMRRIWGVGVHHENIDSPEQFSVVRCYIQKNPEDAGIDSSGRILTQLPQVITCFTTRPDTNFGATFIVLAPEHPFVQKILRDQVSSPSAIKTEIKAYVDRSMKKTELERQEEGRKKTGVFTGFYAINNLNNAKMPIWISDFVLAGFGTGAVVGVPGHDVRDFEFAQMFNIPIVRVVVASDGDTSPITKIDQVQEDEGTMVNSDFLNGLPIMEAKEKIMDYIESKGWGECVTTYRLRDWLISRQRYWGAPIPIVYDPKGNPHPIPEEHLPWRLPTDVEFKPTGKSPLFYSKELKERTEKIFGKGWTPEYDTMDTFVCSSFYQFMYLTDHPHENMSVHPCSVPFIDHKIDQRWMPVNLYIGGPEHACMHLIYARFVTMVLQELGHVKAAEPFRKLVHQGLITNGGAKMSKSKGNVVSPDSFVERYGSDVFRMYLMFMGPFTDGGDWNDTGIKGIDRFVQRFYRIILEQLQKKKKPSTKDVQEDPLITTALQRTIKKVSEEIEAFRFNTALSSIMELLNLLEDKKSFTDTTAETLILLLSPLAPHLCEELWHARKRKGFVVNQLWPTWDPSLIQSSTVRLAIQVNGKLRGEIEVDAKVLEADAKVLETNLKAAASAEENVKRHLAGTITKVIYVPGRLINFVVG